MAAVSEARAVAAVTTAVTAGAQTPVQGQAVLCALAAAGLAGHLTMGVNTVPEPAELDSASTSRAFKEPVTAAATDWPDAAAALALVAEAKAETEATILAKCVPLPAVSFYLKNIGEE